MPDGLVTWVDVAAGEAGIRRRRRQYVAHVADVEPPARRVGARVHFDIRREEGAERAIDVRLRGGMRTGRHHRRFATLVGAHRPDTKGPAPFAVPHPEYGLALAGHPLQVVGQWARSIATGSLDEAVALYAPDARLYIDGDALSGQRHIRTRVATLPVFAAGHLPAVRGEDGLVLARWDAASIKGAALDAQCRVEHGLIAEQWIGAPGPEVAVSVRATATGAVTLTTLTRGEVGGEAIDYARQKVEHLIETIQEPILFARIKLSRAADPARARPAMAQANLDVNGHVVRAHVAAHEMHEAVDLLERRLADKIGHKAERLEALRRHTPGRAEPGEWRHGDLPAVRPEYFDRPVEERQLVRHKAFVGAEQSLDEAAFDMDQLDYDFYLFRDLQSGKDSLLARAAGGAYQVRHLHPAPALAATSAYEIVVDDAPPPTLTVDEAIEQLNLTGDRFVFFASSATGRGAVVYRRYDGHYGLITLE